MFYRVLQKATFIDLAPEGQPQKYFVKICVLVGGLSKLKILLYDGWEDGNYKLTYCSASLVVE